MTITGLAGKVWFDRWKDAGCAFRKHGWLFGLLYSLISLLSLPLGLVFDLILEICTRDLSDKKIASRRKQSLIDAWHLAFLIFTLSALLMNAPTWLLLSFPAFKLLDLFQTMIKLLAFPERGSRQSARPIVHLFIHLLQIVVAFASCYVFISRSCGPSSFLVFGKASESALGPVDALYFSLVTAATVGFGDITPQLPSQAPCSWYCYAAFFVQAEIVTAVVLTLLFAPYFISLATNKKDEE